MQTWTPQQLAEHLQQASSLIQLVDVREAWEYDIVHLKNSRLIPLGQLAEGINQLDQNLSVVVICHHGIRSAHACYVLERWGFQAINLAGGIDRWAREIEPSLPVY